MGAKKSEERETGGERGLISRARGEFEWSFRAYAVAFGGFYCGVYGDFGCTLFYRGVLKD